MAVCTKARDRPTADQHDVALVARVIAGDKSAEDDLWHRYHEQFRRWVQRWNHINEWESLFVDAATSQLFEVLPHYKPEFSAFRSWAFSVARCAVLKQVRDLCINRADIALDEFLEDVLPALLRPEDDFLSSRVDEEVDRLDPERRAAVRGHFYEGKTDEEIAEELHIPRRRVNYRRQQGMAMIRSRLCDVPFTSIRPETRLSGYYYTMTDVKEKEPALLGGKEGDCL